MKAIKILSLCAVLSLSTSVWAQSETETKPQKPDTSSETLPVSEPGKLNWETFIDGNAGGLAAIAKGVIAERYKTDPAFRIEMFEVAKAEHHSGDGQKALSIFTALAEHANHTPSMGWLAQMAYNGEAQEANKALGFEWINKAALAGDVEAMEKTAGLSYMGRGTQQSDIVARHWFLHAADRGSNKGDSLLFKMFREGLGGAADEKMTMVFAKRLAKFNDPEGLYFMGEAYRDAKGVEQNLKEARRMFEWAAEKGHLEAEAALVKMGAVDQETGEPKE